MKKYLKIIEAFNNEKVEYILIGDVAINILGYVRVTEGIDFVIKLDEKNLKALQKALFNVYQDPEIDNLSFNDFKQYSIIRYDTPQGFLIDFIARLGDAHSFENIEHQIIDVKGVKVKLATPYALIKLESNTYRPKDENDIKFLKYNKQREDAN